MLIRQVPTEEPFQIETAGHAFGKTSLPLTSEKRADVGIHLNFNHL